MKYICIIQKKVVILRVLNIYTIIELKSIPNMKKLSLLLISLFVCSMSWAVTPNILATELRYAPHPYLDSYIFSFKTNTKPTVAEIRFYKKDKLNNMTNNINIIHSDIYNKDQHSITPPDYVYRFTAAGTENSTPLKSGLMSVTLRMASGEVDANGQIMNEALPPGELYWSVYVETTKSSDFSEYYRSGYPTDAKYHPLHATVNNYPATDMFGSLIVTNNPTYTDPRAEVGLVTYGLNNDGNYAKVKDYLNGNTLSLNYPHRMAVAPNGKVFIADEGARNGTGYSVTYSRGGVKLWDPITGKVTLFSDNVLNTSTGLALYNHNGTWKLYAANTYGEFVAHGGLTSDNHYSPSNANGVYGKNGFVEHTVNSAWTGYTGSYKQYGLKRGDGNGHIGVVAMEHGVWLCQNRDHNRQVKELTKEALADNLDNYLLSFVPYGASARTWSSCTSNGVNEYYSNRPEYADISNFSQTYNAPVQGTPGAGMTYQKICVGKDGAGNDKYEEYLYVVNHEGDIAKIKLTWSGSGTSIKPNLNIQSKADIDSKVKILKTPADLKATMPASTLKPSQGGKNTSWTACYIMSMEFDYAGNLITVIGNTTHELGAMSHSYGARHQIVLFSMPYNRTNAQEIRASETQFFIPERLSQNDMQQKHIDAVVEPYLPSAPCYLDLYRPLQGGTFNTITLPFDLSTLNNTPYAGAEVRRFTGTELKNVGEENLLYFNFEKVTFSGEDIMKAGLPYVIMPTNDVVGIVSFNKNRIQFRTQYSTELKAGDTYGTGGDDYGMFVGFFPYKDMPTNPETLMLVADNRLAEIEEGRMNGFRAYFQLLKAIPANTLSMLHFKKDAPTGMEIVVDGKVVDVEKFLRDGRVYIRAGETLYTIDGQVVK